MAKNDIGNMQSITCYLFRLAALATPQPKSQFSGLKEENISIQSCLGLSVSKAFKVFGNCLHCWLSKVDFALNYGQDIFNMIMEISDMGNIGE